MKRSAVTLLAMLAFGLALAADHGDDPLVKLLNSRSAQSPSVYAEAAREVRAEADKGGILQRFMIAVISEDPDAPVSARLNSEQRKQWLDETRDRIRRLADKKDNPLAWYLLSLENGSRPMLARAAEGGNVQALNAYGTLLVQDAMGMPADKAKMAEVMLTKSYGYFRTAAIKKDMNGFYNLGMCYLQGYGCERSGTKALECFRLAADRGHPEAINNIGGCYRDGIVVATNLELSVRWFRKSAELGNPYGQLNYALALQRGDGVAKDEEKAARMLKLAAGQECAEAMNVYGMCCYSGRGMKKDLDEAFLQFRRSAERGFPPAMDNLATCYGNGLGTTRDVLKSALWKMRYRAAMGDPEAIAWLKKTEQEEKGAAK